MGLSPSLSELLEVHFRLTSSLSDSTLVERAHIPAVNVFLKALLKVPHAPHHVGGVVASGLSTPTLDRTSSRLCTPLDDESVIAPLALHRNQTMRCTLPFYLLICGLLHFKPGN